MEVLVWEVDLDQMGEEGVVEKLENKGQILDHEEDGDVYEILDHGEERMVPHILNHRKGEEVAVVLLDHVLLCGLCDIQ